MSPPPPLPTDPDAWGAFLCAVPAPILADTAEQLTELALLEERCGNVDAHMIADAVRGDPLMTMRVLSHAGRHRGALRRRRGTLLQRTDRRTAAASAAVHRGGRRPAGAADAARRGSDRA